MTRAEVQRLIDERVTENLRLDYKQTISLKPDSRRELLEDITAFANSGGGSILIGLREPENGQAKLDYPESVYPHGLDFADVRSKLQRSVEDNVRPKLTLFDFEEIDMGSGDSVIAIHVRRSSLRPHMVEKDRRITCTRRNSQGKQIMDATELRQAILNSESVEQRFAELIDRRIKVWWGDLWPHSLPALVTYMVPRSSLEEPFEIAMPELAKLRGIIMPAGLGGDAPRPCADGVERHTLNGTGSSAGNYTVFHRDGLYETGNRNWFFTEKMTKIISGPALQLDLSEILDEGLRAYQVLELPGPYLATAAVLAGEAFRLNGGIKTFGARVLSLPTLQIDEDTGRDDVVLAWMDRLAQASGGWDWARLYSG